MCVQKKKHITVNIINKAKCVLYVFMVVKVYSDFIGYEVRALKLFVMCLKVGGGSYAVLSMYLYKGLLRVYMFPIYNFSKISYI